jgi:hypothetical protein
LSCAKIKKHDKDTSLLCVFSKTHDKRKKIVSPLGANCVNGHWKKNSLLCVIKNAQQTQGFAVRPEKSARQIIFCPVFFLCCAPEIKHTAKVSFPPSECLCQLTL